MTRLSIAIILLFSLPALADEHERFQWDARVQGQEMIYEGADGDYIDNVRTAFRVNGSLNLTKDGCVQLKGRITSGDRYNSEWDYPGIGEKDTDMNVSLRHLSVSFSCAEENMIFEAGAFSPINYGRLGLSTYGWVDGVRVIINEEGTGRQWVARIGSLDELDNANVFERSFGDVNNYSVQMNQEFGQGHNVFISVDKYEDTLFARSGIRLAVQKYLGFIDSVAAEVSTADGDEVGNFVEVAMSRGKYSWRVFRADLEPITVDGEPADKTTQLTKYYYGLGENYFAEVSRPIGDSGKYSGLVLLRDGDAGKMALLTVTRVFGR